MLRSFAVDPFDAARDVVSVRWVRRGVIASTLFVALAFGAAVPAQASPCVSGRVGGVTVFASTGAEQCYVVPRGVTVVHVVAEGAPGASSPNATGGLGATVTADVPVAEGVEVLYVEVGSTGVGSSGGFNGGGANPMYSSGGGGGASDVRTCSKGSCPDLTRNDSRLIVAGGGGGAGSDCAYAGRRRGLRRK